MIPKIIHKNFCREFLRIKTKDAEVVPFTFNESQEKLDNLINQLEREKKPVRIIILKARQLGMSTYTESRIFKNTIFNKNVNSAIITHQETATTNLFNMNKLFYNNMPEDFRPEIKKSNAKELIFDNKEGKGLNSKIKCMTAGSKGVGRSDTINNLHISELAFWEGDVHDTLNGLLQAVPDKPNTMIIIESTANGFDIFKQLWDEAVDSQNKGEENYIPLFFPWYENNEYVRAVPYNFTLTEKEKALKVEYNLTDEQLSWRRYTIKNKCFGDTDEDKELMFSQEYPCCPEEAFISTGRTIFDKEQVIKRINDIRDKKPAKIGSFKYDFDLVEVRNISFESYPQGYIHIYEECKEGHPYVIGGDTAGEGSDFLTAQVIDNSNGVQVATMKCKMDEDLYALQMYCLGTYYNKALIGIESNYSPYAIKTLEKLEYTNQFIRRTEDNYTGKTMRSYGFRTTVKTRPLILSTLVKMFREYPEQFNDIATLKEFLTFIKPMNSDKAQAQNGEHDDLLMACAIAYYLYTLDDQSHLVDKKFKTEINLNTRVWDDVDNEEEGEYISWD